MDSILVVEDDLAVRAALEDALVRLGYCVTAVGTAAEALRTVAAEIPSLVVLDLGLPDLDGASALRMIRGVTSVPVIVATARGEESSVVSLLTAGADDYVVKPFSREHLAARVEALLRRAGGMAIPGRVLEVGELRIDVSCRVASVAGRPLDLTRREFDLLTCLAEHRGRVVTRKALLARVWQYSDRGSDPTLDVHVSGLRRKLGETAAEPRYLHTVRGVGLKLIEPP